jgi:hypothetical protein
MLGPHSGTHRYQLDLFSSSGHQFQPTMVYGVLFDDSLLLNEVLADGSPHAPNHVIDCCVVLCKLLLLSLRQTLPCADLQVRFGGRHHLCLINFLLRRRVLPHEITANPKCSPIDIFDSLAAYAMAKLAVSLLASFSVSERLCTKRCSPECANHDTARFRPTSAFPKGKVRSDDAWEVEIREAGRNFMAERVGFVLSKPV